VLRHSTAKHARVLLVEVLDRGQARAVTGPSGGGHGLLGMRERAAAFGGSCEAGRAPGGGWRVQARIPIDEEQG